MAGLVPYVVPWVVPWVVPCVVALGLGAVPVPVRAQPVATNVLQEAGQRFHPVWSALGMVASQEAIASSVGAQILRRGGNAVDAAAVMQFMLNVVQPQ